MLDSAQISSDSFLAYIQEKKDLKESISQTYVDELKEMSSSLEAKQKELVEVNKISTEQKNALEDLNERHNALVQSCTEADEIMRR